MRAIDIDAGLNGAVHYALNATGNLIEDFKAVQQIVEINKQTGDLYMSSSSEQNNFNEIKSFLNRVLIFTVIARDYGEPESLESALKIRLDLIMNEDPHDVYFRRTYFKFQVSESAKIGQIIGYVNSASHYDETNEGKIIYTIEDGDDLDEFDINYETGALSVRTQLDYYRIDNYYLIIRAYDSFHPNKQQYSNATVHIQIIVIDLINIFFFLI